VVMRHGRDGIERLASGAREHHDREHAAHGDETRGRAGRCSVEFSPARSRRRTYGISIMPGASGA
jgi:hypothetical protein